MKQFTSFKMTPCEQKPNPCRSTTSTNQLLATHINKHPCSEQKFLKQRNKEEEEQEEQEEEEL